MRLRDDLDVDEPEGLDGNRHRVCGHAGSSTGVSSSFVLSF